jgi:hypothetical protein
LAANSKPQTLAGDAIRTVSAEQRLKDLGIELPSPPEPFGTYVEAVQTGNILFLSGMLPTDGHSAKFVGRVGAELDVEAGRKAAHLAAVNVLAVARKHLGRSTERRVSCDSGCRWLLPAMYVISRKRLMPPRSCFNKCSEKTRTLAV